MRRQHHQYLSQTESRDHRRRSPCPGIGLTLVIKSHLYRASLASWYFKIGEWEDRLSLEHHSLSNRYTLTNLNTRITQDFATLARDTRLPGALHQSGHASQRCQCERRAADAPAGLTQSKRLAGPLKAGGAGAERLAARQRLGALEGHHSVKTSRGFGLTLVLSLLLGASVFLSQSAQDGDLSVTTTPH